MAYVVYTSGSTGRPKGVVVEHRSIIARLAPDLFGLRPGKIMAQVAAAVFDASALEIWSALLHGAALVVATDRDATRLGRFVLDQGVTHIMLVPVLLREVLAAIPDALDAVECLLVGGEVLAPELARADRNMVNIYGPTETTAIATAYPITGDVGRTVPIGRPLPNTQITLVDAAGELVPPGAAGEILIGGAGVARGYLKQPELSGERFVGGCYRSGDLGRWQPDGNLAFLGRLDDQVKVRGVRVEPGEIQSCLTGLPEVADSLVQFDGDSVIAYVVRARGARPTAATIRAELTQILPSQLVPTMVVVLDAWPLTAGGKVDRNALPTPHAQPDTPYVAPRNQVEAAIADIATELLGLDRVGVHDNFFELGGQSILATRFAARIRSSVGVAANLSDVFACPTIAQLAALDRTTAPVPISRLPRRPES